MPSRHCSDSRAAVSWVAKNRRANFGREWLACARCSSGIKRVVDYNVRVRVKPDGSGMATAGLKMSINPFDEIAIEAALRLKESGASAEVVARDDRPRSKPSSSSAPGWRWAPTARSVSARGRARAARPSRARCTPSSLREQPDASSLLGKQADRRRPRPDRANARGAVGPAAGDVSPPSSPSQATLRP